MPCTNCISLRISVLLILLTIAFAATVQTQILPPDCSQFPSFPYWSNNPINCGAYWYCPDAASEPVANQCPDGTNFDSDTSMCLSPEDSPCEDPEDPDPTDPPTDPPTDTTEATTTTRPPPVRNFCEGVEDGRLVNNPTGCRSYFLCTNEVAYPRQCDMGFNFNQELQICDRASLTPCSNDDFECPSWGISRWEVPGSCTEYNYCFGGQHRVHECAPGLTFDVDMALCALQEEVECTRDVCPINNDIDDVVTFPSEHDCEQYYKCYDGQLQLQYCAPRTHWNQERQRCERPEDAECDLATEPPTEPFECPPGDDLSFLPHPTICQNYFICSGGVAHEMECDEDLLFDALRLVCKIAERATCADGATLRIAKRKTNLIDYIARGF